uniref:dolichyl-diphosphooligosaccharide--protein glycotransferase n=1 Tax=Trypanosoma brucei rhodesiense TaxID=31286 RepID=F4Y9K7_TRYBR|nr:putative oligosaccharyl transferase STT3 subunit [Trypanosoma brucei rhodesiense]
MTKGGKVAVTKGSAQSDGAGEGGMSKAKSSTTFVATGGGSLPAWALKAVSTIVSAVILIYSVHRAYDIRLTSVRLYGELIHEFDPWFNYRATQYLSDNGWRAFFQWYDYMSWYPLGRPVGTTIFPGMQLTGVAIHRVLEMLGRGMSINNICVYIPAWFGSIATVLAALIAYESSNSLSVMAFTAYFFSIVPAHLMRSMAGEFDNECVAMAAMLLTFYMWVRSLRSSSSWPIGALAGVAYGYMVSTWGGYIFVLNMVAFHASVCVLLDWARGTYSVSLLRAYSLFFVIGTALAICVPPVEWTPFRSLEQLTALFVFVFMWALHYSEYLRERARAPIHSSKALQIRARIFMGTLSLLLIVASLLAPFGFFKPTAYRVRALFVKHTRTGNPLVDSVAEHRPTTAGAYLRYFHVCYPLWGCGGLSMLVFMKKDRWRAIVFLASLSTVTMYFSARMSRLLLLAGPAATACAGMFIGGLFDLALSQFGDLRSPKDASGDSDPAGGSKRAKGKVVNEPSKRAIFSHRWFQRLVQSLPVPLRRGIAVVVLVCLFANPMRHSFEKSCEKMAHALSSPRIIAVTDLPNGERVLADDYYVSYLWLRNNTPEDARILSWWDYGYQITGIGNRTTLADGNTWSHKHIATIGKMLTSPVKESHALIRHLADYVLIWSGQDGSDLLKSPHMARIGNSVYRDMCSEDDPLCRQFGFYSGDLNKPTPMMQRSLLYNLHRFGTDGGKTQLDKNMFQLAYVSKYGLVKIYKVMNVSEESKAWVADPKNRVCDPPGSWICAGQYPPAKEIQDMLAKRFHYE